MIRDEIGKDHFLRKMFFSVSRNGDSALKIYTITVTVILAYTTLQRKDFEKPLLQLDLVTVTRRKIERENP